jgi:hypothetical protein
MSTTEYIKELGIKITIVKELSDYSNSPFVKRKKEEAIKFIEKNGIPEDFKKKK